MSALDPAAPGLPIVSSGGGGITELTGDTTGSGSGSIVTTTVDLTIASEARGDLLRRGASAWERVAAKTAGSVMSGDGTDAVSVPIATPLAVSASANRTALGVDLLRWMGAWDVATAYVAGDGVTSAGSTWRALRSVTGGSAPSEGADWTVFASKGDTGATGPTGPTGPAGGSPVYTPSLTATGAVLTNGVGTASASSTAVTLSVGGATLSTWYSGTYNAPRITITPQSSWSPAISPHRFDASARIASRSGTGGAVFTNTVALLGIDGGATARYSTYAKVSTVGSENESSSGAAGITSTTSAGLSWDGNDWLRIRVDGPAIMFYFGRGSGGAAPAATAWVSIGSTTWTVPANGAGFAVTIALVQSTAGTGGSGPTIVLDNFTFTGIT